MEYLKHLLIRTPFERPLQQLRRLADFRRRRKHPELADIYAEDERIEQLLARVLRPGSNCLDVGCHLGSFLSQILARSPQGQHMAFEALPQKAEWLKKKFPEVTVTHAAVGAEPGEITFYRNLSRSGFSGMSVHARPDDKVEEIKVRCERLDAMVPADRQVDFMKVDVEGAELSVLRGAADLLRRCRPVLLFECTMDGLKSAGSTPEEIYALLTGEHGYGVYLLKDWLSGGPGLALERFRQAMKYPFQAFNFVAAPPDRPAGAAAGQAAA